MQDKFDKFDLSFAADTCGARVKNDMITPGSFFLFNKTLLKIKVNHCVIHREETQTCGEAKYNMGNTCTMKNKGYFFSQCLVSFSKFLVSSK